MTNSNEVLTRDWSYEIGDRLFTYVVGGGDWANSERLFVFKRNEQIYYGGDLHDSTKPKFQEYFGMNPLSYITQSPVLGVTVE
ncbi:hypothetical protein [uncultured Nostoc sp.]|uniref:hypothetical protein n=1 Tax=uncultured Nostoc sp. TaxID=340711 RepID=UPI0035C9DB95